MRYFVGEIIIDSEYGDELGYIPIGVFDDYVVAKLHWQKTTEFSAHHRRLPNGGPYQWSIEDYEQHYGYRREGVEFYVKTNARVLEVTDDGLITSLVVVDKEEYQFFFVDYEKYNDDGRGWAYPDKVRYKGDLSLS